MQALILTINGSRNIQIDLEESFVERLKDENTEQAWLVTTSPTNFGHSMKYDKDEAKVKILTIEPIEEFLKRNGSKN